MEWELEGVGGGLPLGDRQALGQAGTGRHADADVGQLAGRAAVQDVLEQVEQPGGGRGGRSAQGDLPHRGGEHQVAGEDAGRLAVAPGPVRRGPVGQGTLGEGADHVGSPAAHPVAVDDVVVDDEGGVEQLERVGEPLRGRGVESAEGGVGTEQEAGAEPLAALRGQVDLGPEDPVVLVERAAEAGLEEPVGGSWGGGQVVHEGPPGCVGFLQLTR